MARKPVRASLQFDLDHNALLVVEKAVVEDQHMVVINIAPGGSRRGRNVTLYLQLERARELAKQIVEIADGT